MAGESSRRASCCLENEVFAFRMDAVVGVLCCVLSRASTGQL